MPVMALVATHNPGYIEHLFQIVLCSDKRNNNNI